MAEAKSNELMEKIVSLCKRRGFVFQSSEIYGGINGFWDYGPLGAELKRNVKELWWRSMTRFRDDVVGLDATIIMHPEIWRASGHVETFADLMRECPITKKRVRADQVDPQTGVIYHFAGALGMTREPVEGKKPYEDDGFNFIPETLERWAKRTGKDLLLLTQEEFEEDLVEVLLMSKPQPSRAESHQNAKAWINGLWNKLQRKSIRILIPLGKPPESAIKLAKQFYIQQGVLAPIPILGREPQKVENTTDFHPESGVELSEARPFNLMFKSHAGPVESDENLVYLRPETAQAIFAQFKNVAETSRQTVPFGIAQIGKAFRNEVTPRNFTFRSREFEQMELEFFIKPDEAVEAVSGQVSKVGGEHPGEPQPNWGWQTWHKYWVEERIRFYESIGLPRQSLVEYWQKPEELAHYARATVDILYKFPFSKRDEKGELMGEELEGVAARSDFDLSQHERFSGKPMSVFDEELRAAWAKLDDAKKKELGERYYQARLKYLVKTGVPAEKAEKEAKEDAEGLAKGQYIPHVIEPSAGVDRLVLALICNAYQEEEAPDEKGKMETRVVMKFHPRIAPIKVGVFPLLKNKPELVKKAQQVRDLLRPHMTVFYDEAGAIGRRYRRQDEAGTPFGVTIDFDTLGEKPEFLDTVTLRERDSMKQTRVKIADLLGLLLEKIR